MRPTLALWAAGWDKRGDLATVFDRSAVQRQFVDGARPVVATTDALGRQTRLVPDKLNRITAVTDPIGGQTAFSYDPNAACWR